mmetsp:Transcript_9529/g.10858  ORF Transcript_9529/g.10858 Transcript_9529/m.10858 type:complete len:387 (+) Transcript_9529:180-1340(+)|eukprot:CAMPEP_0184018070 /NCGR_PEP_ID=MMETSP0954-20121128/7918_1 /TAXON_ID=627963 /ORGANISM="Aplanochytrium sp, Strain PBS07" /LENGTH=386 /DNA_ID=CAMNT_0026299437 /DNA_START=236 /DNA_END=1396 /DNA_ORIENTATION=-
MPNTPGMFVPVAKPLHRQRSTNAVPNVIQTKKNRKQSLVSMVSKVGGLFQKKSAPAERVPEKLPLERKLTRETHPFNFRVRRELPSYDLHKDMNKFDYLSASDYSDDFVLQRERGSRDLKDLVRDVELDSDDDSDCENLQHRLRRTHPSRELHSLLKITEDAEREQYSLQRTRPSRELHSLVKDTDFDFSSDEDSDDDFESTDLPPIASNRIPQQSAGVSPPVLPPRPRNKEVAVVAKPLDRYSLGQEPILRTFYVTDDVDEITNSSVVNVAKLGSNVEEKAVRNRRKAVLLRNETAHLTQMPYDSSALERYKRMQITGLSKRLIVKQMVKDGIDPSCLYGVNHEARSFKNPWVKAYNSQKGLHYWKNINTREVLMEETFDENKDL